LNRAGVAASQAQVMGRTSATLAQRTSVKAWAETTVCLGGGANKKYLNFFAKAGSHAMPTTFHSCLAKGVPAPRLRYPNGQEGPARKIEHVVPGTLKWLIHPLWSTFDTPCESVFDLHRLMAALAQPVVDCLFDPASPLLRRRGRALRPFCERLFEIGTLDALAALVYCGYEAVMANDLAAARAVERTLRQRLPDWPCLQHLKETTRRSIAVLCREAIDASSVQPSRREDAPWAVATEIIASRFVGPSKHELAGSAQDIGLVERVLKAP